MYKYKSANLFLRFTLLKVERMIWYNVYLSQMDTSVFPTLIQSNSNSEYWWFFAYKQTIVYFMMFLPEQQRCGPIRWQDCGLGRDMLQTQVHNQLLELRPIRLDYYYFYSPKGSDLIQSVASQVFLKWTAHKSHVWVFSPCLMFKDIAWFCWTLAVDLIKMCVFECLFHVMELKARQSWQWNVPPQKSKYYSPTHCHSVILTLPFTLSF